MNSEIFTKLELFDQEPCSYEREVYNVQARRS